MALGPNINVLGGGSVDLADAISPTFINVTATGQFLAANGTSAAPGYAYTSRPSDGLYSAALGSLGVSTKTLQGPSYLSTTSAAGSAFTNQPSNDSVTVVSSSAADVTQVVTIIGTTTATNTVVTENITLTGTTGVVSAKVNWGQVLAVKISASCAGTMTVKKTTGALTIVAITTTNLSAGVNTVSAANVYAYNQLLSTVASGATTKQVGWSGTNSSGTTIYDSVALTGATAVASNSTFLTLAEIYTGDVEGTRTVTVTTNGTFTIQAGALALTATGTNQSITLTPSGTGAVLATAAVYASGGFGNSANGDLIFSKSSGATEFARFKAGTLNLLLGGLPTDGTGVLQFPAATTSAGGITFGTEINVYRSGTNTLMFASGGTDMASFTRDTASGGLDVVAQGANQSLYFASNGSGGISLNGGSGAGSIILQGGTNVSTTAGPFYGAQILRTYNQASGTAANTDLLINRTQTAVGSGAQLLIDAQVGSVSKFSVSNTGLLAAAGAASSTSTALVLPGGTTAVSSLRITHGAAPTSPVDGDMWSTTTTLNFRLNGVTKSITMI